MSETHNTFTLGSSPFADAPGMAQNVARAWSIGDHDDAWNCAQGWAGGMPGWALGELLLGRFTVDGDKVTLTEPEWVPGSKGLLDIFTIRPVKATKAKRGAR